MIWLTEQKNCIGYGRVDENEAFSDWLDDYVAGLDDDKACEFFYNHMNADLNLDDISYDVEIPKAIVEMAQNA